MDKEIDVAVAFLMSHFYDKVPRRKVLIFGEELKMVLKGEVSERKDGGYDKIPILLNRPDGAPMDALINEAASHVAFNIADVERCCPSDLSLVIAKGRVLCTIGRETGMTNVLYDENRAAAGKEKSRFRFGPAGDGETEEDSFGTKKKLTAAEFAMTRFGNAKQKTNLLAIKAIQEKALKNNILKARTFGPMMKGKGGSNDSKWYAGQPVTSLNGSVVMHGHYYPVVKGNPLMANGYYDNDNTGGSPPSNFSSPIMKSASNSQPYVPSYPPALVPNQSVPFVSNRNAAYSPNSNVGVVTNIGHPSYFTHNMTIMKDGQFLN